MYYNNNQINVRMVKHYIKKFLILFDNKKSVKYKLFNAFLICILYKIKFHSTTGFLINPNIKAVITEPITTASKYKRG